MNEFHFLLYFRALLIMLLVFFSGSKSHRFGVFPLFCSLFFPVSFSNEPEILSQIFQGIMLKESFVKLLDFFSSEIKTLTLKPTVLAGSGYNYQITAVKSFFFGCWKE